MNEKNTQTTFNSSDWFHFLATKVSDVTGSHWSFFIALLIIIIWGLTGRFFDYSDTWQLVINTATTIVTFLMVFLIQNTQNRDAKAMQLKLDELIRAVHPARNTFVNLEELSDSELIKMQSEFRTLHEKAIKIAEKRHNQNGTS